MSGVAGWLARGTRCTICGAVPSRFVVSLHGRRTCASHRVAERCFFCSEPGEFTRLGPTITRCPTCTATATVERRDDIEQELPRIRAELQRLGFGLQRRVIVELATSGELHSLSPDAAHAVLGETRLQVQYGSAKAVNVLILRGLPVLWFGRTVAHENMHAWLAEQGWPPRTPRVEEGLCELVAYAWLKAQPGKWPAALRSAMLSGADPLYGAGFHAVQDAVRRRGISGVLESVRKSGRLPEV